MSHPIVRLLLLLGLGACATGAAVRPAPDGEDFEEFRQRLEAAALSLMNGDGAAWDEVYSHADDATLFGGWGGAGERGWDELAARWQMVKGRYQQATLEIERISDHVAEDLAVTVEIWRGEASFSNGASGPIALRVTHVCRREEGQWRVVHRHADEQMELRPIEAHIQR